MKINQMKLIAQSRAWAGLSLCLALILLTACRSMTWDVSIDANISPPPVVGEIVTLHIEMISPKYGGDGGLVIFHSEEINFLDVGPEWQSPAAGVGGDGPNLRWEGPVVAGESVVHELTLCVTKPGNWGIYLAGGVDGKPGENRLHIISTADSALVIPISQSPDLPIAGKNLEP